MKWQQLMKQVDAMIKRGQGDLYDRVKLLVSIYDDPEFLSSMQQSGEKPFIYLNQKVKDAFTTFAELRQIYLAFPERKQWADGDLLRMSNEVNRSLLEKEKRQKQEREPEPRMSWKERALEAEKRVEAMEQNYKLLKERCRVQENELKELHKILGTRSRKAG